jgi:hypothetical protein
MQNMKPGVDALPTAAMIVAGAIALMWLIGGLWTGLAWFDIGALVLALVVAGIFFAFHPSRKAPVPVTNMRPGQRI